MPDADAVHREAPSPPPRPLARALAAVLVGLLEVGCSASRPPASTLAWSQPVASDAALLASEKGRDGAGFSQAVTYQLAARPTNGGTEDLALFVRRADGSEGKALDRVRLGESGQLVESRPGEAGAIPVAIRLRGLAPGEAVELALAAPDGWHLARTTVVPRPVEAGDPQGCRMSAALERRPVLAYRVFLHGFPAGEAVEVTLSASDTKQRVQGRPSDVGFLMPLDPVVNAEGPLRLTAKSPACSVAASIDWSDVPR